MFTPDQLLAIAALSGFLGAAYQFSQNRTDARNGYNIAQRVFSMLVGAFLCALLAYLFIIEWEWNGVLIAILNLFFGLGAERFIRLAMDSQNSARSNVEFIEKWKRVRKALSDEPSNSDNQPPINDTQP